MSDVYVNGGETVVIETHWFMIPVSTNGYVLCICYLISVVQPFPLLAQAALTGWGPYQIGKTTPDSLPGHGFREQPQPFVKGTIALPCAHIRLFQADTTQLENITATNVLLAFYDNKLFMVACDGSAAVRQAFYDRYGKGVVSPIDTVRLCEVEKPTVVEREMWQHPEINALFIRLSGYSPQCQPVTQQKLLIVDQRTVALTSDCRAFL